jgi:hypothetical protein
MVLIATLVNRTEKPMVHVGVLVTATGKNDASGSLVEYEFHDRLAASETRRRRVGEEYAAIENGYSADAHLGTISSCQARIVTYADGSTWSVSPL